MFLNHIKIAFRKLRREKLHSLINITGLSIGLACCILIFLFVQDEIKYDKFQENAPRIYRLLNAHEGSSKNTATHHAPMLPAMKENIPEIEQAARMILYYDDKLVSYEEKQYLSDLIYSDPGFFKMFSFELVKGNPVDILDKPMSAVLTESTARKYFGNSDPMGKIITLDNKYNLTITGIMENFPGQSHLQADMVISYKSMQEINPYAYSWKMRSPHIYLMAQPNTNPDQLKTKIKDVYMDVKPDYFAEQNFDLQPMEEVYLHSSEITWDKIEKGNFQVISGLSIVAILILLIACFNYMNLTTANYSKEASHISISKTLGANRRHLISKYFTETIMITFIAIWLAIILSEIFIPAFNNFTGKSLTINLLQNHALSLSLVLVFIFTVLLGGSYPAFFLSSFKPLRIKKNSNILSGNKSSGHSFWRKSFVIAQYMITIVLMISTFIIYRQIKLITQEKTGFDKEQVIAVKNPWDQDMTRRYNRYLQKIQNNPDILAAAGSFNIPGENLNNYASLYSTEDNKHKAAYNVVSPEVFNVLNSKFEAGRNFKKELRTDSAAVILNQKAADVTGLQNPVGKEVYFNYFGKKPARVIGVIQNIQYASLHEENTPVVYVLNPGRKTNVLVKMQKGRTKETLAYLKDSWKKVSPQWPFRYEFLDEKIDNVYKTELKTIALIKIFTLLSVILSCLGIFGFAGFAIKRRTKEIGVRKVNGATVASILKLLNKDFIKWIAISFAIASPIAYYLMQQWLKNYAYKTAISWWIFALAGTLTIIVATLTVSWQSWKAARQNPVDSLRYE